MRTATLVLLAYALLVVVGSAWRFLLTPVAQAVPDIAALTAGFLGLTARRDVGAALAGSIVLGYLRDVVGGAPPGFFALVLALTCLTARGVQQVLYVRGPAMTIAFSVFVAVVSSVVSRLVRSAFDIPGAELVLELRDIVFAVGATAVAGPFVWRLFRRVDAAFARTHRDRDAALDGVSPR